MRLDRTKCRSDFPTHHEVILDWIRKAHETSTYTTSVCTGSLLLAAAGILDGLQPPHDAGALHKVDAAVLARVQKLAALRN